MNGGLKRASRMDVAVPAFVEEVVNEEQKEMDEVLVAALCWLIRSLG